MFIFLCYKDISKFIKWVSLCAVESQKVFKQEQHHQALKQEMSLDDHIMHISLSYLLPHSEC